MVIKDEEFVYGVVCDGCGNNTDGIGKFMHYLPEGWSRLSLYHLLNIVFSDYALDQDAPDREYCPVCTKKISETNVIPNSFITDVKITEDNIEYKFNNEAMAVKFIDEKRK